MNDDTPLFIHRQNLREIGFTQPDKIFLPILEKINQQVAHTIDREVRMNIKPEMLPEYLELLGQHPISSPIAQRWLKQHVPDIDSITTDRINIALADAQLNRKISE